MLICLVIALTGLASNQAEFKTDHVRISVDIHSNIYTYRVTNLGTNPIVHFEVRQHAAYDFIAPEGWQKEVSSSVFRAWTSNPETAIHSRETARFSLRVSSKGAVLGRTLAKVRLQSGETVTLSGVWTPVPEPCSYIALVAGLVLVVLLLHTGVLAYRDRRARKSVN